jgi:hypothetical protein
MTDLPLASSHPFYRRLNEVLRLGDFKAKSAGFRTTDKWVNLSS